jgi:galactose mutarotase-like enzyme
LPLETLTLAHAGVTAELVPARGAIVTALAVEGTDVLYLDRATLEDPGKNVRGGIPILFPYAGRLAGDRLLPAGTSMKQHGFGRNKAWDVRARRADSVHLALRQDEETRAAYPYEFDVEYGVHLLGRGLQVDLTVHNHDAWPLPVAPGWHPYFRCPAAGKRTVDTDVPGLRPAEQFGDDREFDFGVAAPRSGHAHFAIPGLGHLHLSFSPAMRHLQLWSQPGKDFVCLEPFCGPADVVNTDRRFDVPPGEGRHFWMRIELGR